MAPANQDASVASGFFRLSPRRGMRRVWYPADRFLRSLAEDQGEKAIAVILSGVGTDGVEGCRVVREADGTVLAQDPESDGTNHLPVRAVGAGATEKPNRNEIAARLAALLSKPPEFPRRIDLPLDGNRHLQWILGRVHSVTGVDFQYYKRNTLLRSIRRRMGVHRLNEIEEYASLLEMRPGESEKLYADMLIQVTSFFRDSETFSFLEKRVFPQLIGNRRPDEPFRIWVPGCSTGEEAYSIAISLMEFLRKTPATGFHFLASVRPLQLFATDLSESSLQRARAGIYSAAAIENVPAGLLHAYFKKVAMGWQIRGTVREMCIFARQDVVSDPPFSNMDLVSCRNLLIYLEPALQNRLTHTFHYALRSGGFLVLGSSETLTAPSDKFQVVDKKQKVYRKDTSRGALARSRTFVRPLTEPGCGEAAVKPTVFPAGRELDRVLLSKYVPASVLVNEALDILEFRGNVSPYLEPVPGRSTWHLSKIVKRSLLLDLQAAIRRARKTNLPVRKEGLLLRFNKSSRPVNLEVVPIHSPQGSERHYAIQFEDAARPAKNRNGEPIPLSGKSQGVSAATRRENRKLKRELVKAQRHLQSFIDEHEATLEQFRSANEEILSTNEELQSTNEELETAGEELQSSNEELNTLTEELRNRNESLTIANDDLFNLLANIQIPIVLLGSDLRIRKFNPAAQSLLNLLPPDIGRRIGDIRPNLGIVDLEDLARETVVHQRNGEREVQDSRGVWYEVRTRPYQTADGRTDGVVVSVVNVDAIKRLLEESRMYAASVIKTAKEPLLFLDRELRVTHANPAYFEKYGLSRGQTENRLLRELPGGLWNIPALLRALKRVLTENYRVEDFETEQELAGMGRRVLLIDARRIEFDKDRASILMSVRDITERRRAQEAIRRQAELLDLAHDSILVRDPSGVILFWNRSAEQVYGWKREEVVGKIVRDLLRSEYPGSEWALLDKVFRDGHWEGELWQTCRDGSRIRVESRWALHRDAKGASEAIIEINRDVTQRKQAEEALRESERQLHAILDTSTSIIFLKDLEGRYLYVNPPFRRLIDLPRDQIVGKTDAELFSPQQAAAFRGHDLDALQAGVPLVFEENALQQDGTHTSVVSKFPIRDQHGKIYAVCGIVTDITAQKRAESKFRNLLECAPDAMVIVDEHGRVALANAQTEKLFGYSRQELLGKDADILIPERFRAVHMGHFKDYLGAPHARAISSGLELYGRRKDGNDFPVEISLSPLETEEGILISAGIRDITVRKQAERALSDLSRSLLQARDDERRRVARDLHDSTGQKLAALNLQLGVLRSRTAELVPELAALAQESEQISSQLSAEIRTMSYLLHPPLLDEMGLIPAIRWLVEGLNKRGGFTVELTMPPEFPRLSGEAEIAIFRIVQESVTNSLRHSGATKAWVQLSLHKKTIHLEISDRGKAPKTDANAQDNGVGITGMTERVKQLGGRLRVSFGDSGTTVRAAIPYRPKSPES